MSHFTLSGSTPDPFNLVAEVNTYTTDLVVILLDLDDGTYDITPPVPRWIAEAACYGFGTYAEPWNGRRVIQALLIPRERWVH